MNKSGYAHISFSIFYDTFNGHGLGGASKNRNTKGRPVGIQCTEAKSRTAKLQEGGPFVSINWKVRLSHKRFWLDLTGPWEHSP